MKPIRQNRFLRSLLQKTPLFTPLKRWHRRRELDHLYGQMLAGGTLAWLDSGRDYATGAA